MKPFFLVTVAALMLGTDSFAIGNDFDARLDDFKIQEDKKSLDKFRKKDVIEKPKDNYVAQVKDEDTLHSIPSATKPNAETLKGISWKQITLDSDITINLEIPDNFRQKDTKNQWVVEKGKKTLSGFTCEVTVAKDKKDKEELRSVQKRKKLESEMHSMYKQILTDLQSSSKKINGKDVYIVSGSKIHDGVKYHVSTMVMYFIDSHSVLTLGLTTIDNIQTHEKIINHIAQSVKIAQPVKKTKSKPSNVKTKGKVLKLHEAEAGEADDVIKKIKSLYGSSKETGYSIAKIDLNGDNVEEVIVHVNQIYGGFCRDYEGTCMIGLFQQNKDQKWDWISMSTSHAKEISILPTATNGYYDLAIDNVLHTHTGDRFGYRKGDKPGVLASTKEALLKTTLKRVENFGLSIQISTAWKSKSASRVFNSINDGWVNYEGTLPGAEKMVSLAFLIVQKADKHYEYEHSSQNKMLYRYSKIGSGIINGHTVNVYYYDSIYDGNKDTKRGGVYLLFEDKMSFSDTRDQETFTRYAYIKLNGDLFFNLNEKDIQPILDDYITPFLNTIQVTKNNSFITDTTTENIPLQLSYEKNNGQPQNIVTEEDKGKSEENITTHDSKKIENKYMKTELHEAARTGNLTQLQKALKDGVEVNAVDKLGRTPLHYAAFSGYVSIARILLEKGADINAVDRAKQWTPLFFAVYMNQKSMIRFLLQSGADQTSKDKFGKTADDYRKDK